MALSTRLGLCENRRHSISNGPLWAFRLHTNGYPGSPAFWTFTVHKVCYTLFEFGWFCCKQMLLLSPLLDCFLLFACLFVVVLGGGCVVMFVFG